MKKIRKSIVLLILAFFMLITFIEKPLYAETTENPVSETEQLSTDEQSLGDVEIEETQPIVSVEEDGEDQDLPSTPQAEEALSQEMETMQPALEGEQHTGEEAPALPAETALTQEENSDEALSEEAVPTPEAVAEGTEIEGYSSFMMARAPLRSVNYSADLKDFLSNLTIDATQNPDGSYIIVPGQEYSATLSFKEKENLQFTNDVDLVYEFPNGALFGDAPASPFDIDIVDDTGNATIHGNTFELIDGKIIVKFNQADPNYERLKALGNIAFNIDMKLKFDQSFQQMEFSVDIIKKFEFDTSGDMTITKTGAISTDGNNIEYELTVKSIGVNNNVVIDDNIVGSFLQYNDNATIIPVSGGMPENFTIDHNNPAKGFTINIPTLANNQEFKIKYSAKILYDNITSQTNSENTKNIAGVDSDKIERKEVSKSFPGQDLDALKKAAGTAVDIPGKPGFKKVPWKIEINKQKKFNVSGWEVYDFLNILEADKYRANFIGNGIKVTINKEDGSSQTLNISWEDVFSPNPKPANIKEWRYKLPNDAGKAYVTIEADTEIDANGIFGDLRIKNTVNVKDFRKTGEVTIKADGIGPENKLSIEKKYTNVGDKEIEWQIKVHVIQAGYPMLSIVDDFPNILHDGVRYKDAYVDGSLNIQGLIADESYKMNLDENDNRKAFVIDFYKNGNQTGANRGLLPVPDAAGRDIIITFRTSVNQDILNIAAEAGYVGRVAEHKNTASATVNAIVVYSTASAKPVKKTIAKSLVGQAEEDGLPVYSYELTLGGVHEDNVIISDDFDQDRLKFYEAKGIKIIADGTETTSGVSAVETTTGMDIKVTSFPKDASGKFYSTYKIAYSLVPKDITTLQNEATHNNGVIEFKNIAEWGDLKTDEVIAKYEYSPYAKKEQIVDPSAANDYTAKFRITINQFELDLYPDKDFFDVEDELSNNLRLLPDTITVSPSDGIDVGINGNTITFKNVPDEKTIIIEYETKVLGSGVISYSNKVKIGNYEVNVENNVTKIVGGSGTGSNPSITLIKRDADDFNQKLAGAKFELYDATDPDNPIPVLDKNGNRVSFTTGADGKALIIGHQTSLGWVLWADRPYQLVEISAPIGYESVQNPIEFILKDIPENNQQFSIVGGELFVSNERPKIEVEANKEWVNGPAIKPTVWFKLYRKINGGNLEPVPNTEIKKLENGTDTVKWTDIYKADTSNNDYTFEVKEVDASGNDFVPQNYTKVESGLKVTNTYDSPKIEVEATKIWVNGPSGDHTAVTFKLFRQITGGTKTEVTGVNPTVTGTGPFNYKWTNLPKTDDNGNEYTYTVEEAGVVNDTITVGNNTYEVTQQGNTVTNTYVVPKIEVEATKIWVNGPAGDHTAVTFKLFRQITGGTKTEVTGVTPTVTGTGPFNYKWIDLPKTDDNGNEYTYTVEEAGVVNDTITVGNNTYEVTQLGNTITNTYVIPKIEVEATKIWVNGPAGDHTAVTFKLFRQITGGTKTEVTGVNPTVTGTGPFNYKWTNLPKTDDNGNEYTYTVEEAGVVNDTITVGNNTYEVTQQGNTVTNTYVIPKIDIRVKKTWTGPTPHPTIYFQLLRNGTELGTPIELTDGNVEYVWSNYDKTDAHGNLYEYTVKELHVPGYKSEVIKESAYNILVNNTYIPVPNIPNEPGRYEVPNTSSSNEVSGYIAMILLSFSMLFFTNKIRKNTK